MTEIENSGNFPVVFHGENLPGTHTCPQQPTSTARSADKEMISRAYTRKKRASPANGRKTPAAPGAAGGRVWYRAETAYTSLTLVGLFRVRVRHTKEGAALS